MTYKTHIVAGAFLARLGLGGDIAAGSNSPGMVASKGY